MPEVPAHQLDLVGARVSGLHHGSYPSERSFGTRVSLR